MFEFKQGNLLNGASEFLALPNGIPSDDTFRRNTARDTIVDVPEPR